MILKGVCENEDFEKIHVIHNLQFFCDVKSIEDYIKNTIEKSVFSNLKKNNFILLDVEKEEYKTKKPYYFRENTIRRKDIFDYKNLQFVF